MNLDKRKVERYFYLAMIVVIGLLYYQTFDFPPRIVVYPRSLLIGLGICILVLLVKNIVQQKKLGAEIENVSMGRLLLTLSMFLIYILIMPLIGYFIDTLIFLTALIWYLKVESYKAMVAVACSSVVLLYLVFEFFLRVWLPRGIIWGF